MERSKLDALNQRELDALNQSQLAAEGIMSLAAMGGYQPVAMETSDAEPDAEVEDAEATGETNSNNTSIVLESGLSNALVSVFICTIEIKVMWIWWFICSYEVNDFFVHLYPYSLLILNLEVFVLFNGI